MIITGVESDTATTNSTSNAENVGLNKNDDLIDKNLAAMDKRSPHYLLNRPNFLQDHFERFNFSHGKCISDHKKRVFIGGLNPSTTESKIYRLFLIPNFSNNSETLLAFFSDFGIIQDVLVVRCPETLVSR